MQTALSSILVAALMLSVTSSAASSFSDEALTWQRLFYTQRLELIGITMLIEIQK